MVLRSLGMPPEQYNERSALTLLALLGLGPGDPWSAATDPMMGITPMMEFFREHYNKKYKPNSRETVRRFTIHQFEQDGLVISNPDRPRPINSPDYVYQISNAALALLRTFDGPGWEQNLDAYLQGHGTLMESYAAAREINRIPISLPDGGRIELTGAGQNALIKKVIEEFCPVFVPGGSVLYIGDAGNKRARWDTVALAKLGLRLDAHGKMPDVVIHCGPRNWLVLIEAVTSHGPVDPKRHRELRTLFAKSRAGLVFVTAFLDRKTMAKFIGRISWETEAWIAEDPGHLIHLNGHRFLGPYE